jgi:hypothetical protein
MHSRAQKTASAIRSAESADDLVPAVLAGYRIVRRLPDRLGRRVLVALHDDPAHGRLPVTITTYTSSDGGGGADGAVSTLERLAAPSIPAVLDVVMDRSTGAAAVVTEFTGDTLASVVSAGAKLSAGEVVTIAAPIYSALLGLHDRGVAHGRMSMGTIGIGVAGRPLLLGCEQSRALSTDRRERDREAGADLTALADVVLTLADAVDDRSARERVVLAAGAIRSGGTTPFSASSRTAGECRLFEVAEARPLSFTGGEQGSGLEALPSPDRATAALVSRASRRVRPTTERRALRATAALRAASTWVRTRAAALPLPPTLARVRKPLVLGASLTAILVSVVLLALPAQDSDAQMGTPSGEEADSRESAAVEHLQAAPTAENAARPAEGDGPAEDGPPATRASPEDAIAGTRAALDAISRCSGTAGEDAACWEAALEPGSALATDVRSNTADPAAVLPPALLRPVGAVELEPREEYGDAVVVVISPVDGSTTPASVLMVRTEAGWRMRDVLPD